MIKVEHQRANRRFTAVVDGEEAVLDYTLAAGVMTITHTGVPQPIERRGIAGQLMREALNVAAAHGWRVVGACSYAAAYLEKHPAERAPRSASQQHESDLLDEALDESFPASDPPSVGRST